MNLVQALRLQAAPCLALVGAGGKTTALFQAARQLPPPVIVTATTHLASTQLFLADHHYVVRTADDISRIEKEILSGVSVLTGDEAQPGRTLGLDMELIEAVRSLCAANNIPLLIEADGSRQKPVKAPAEHEPAIPAFVSQVVVVAGLSAFGKPLTADWVHRPERFAALAGLELGTEIKRGYPDESPFACTGRVKEYSGWVTTGSLAKSGGQRRVAQDRSSDGRPDQAFIRLRFCHCFGFGWS